MTNPFEVHPIIARCGDFQGNGSDVGTNRKEHNKAHNLPSAQLDKDTLPAKMNTATLLTLLLALVPFHGATTQHEKSLSS
jgi:hypothetical protein